MASLRVRVLRASLAATLAGPFLVGAPASAREAALPPFLGDHYAPILAAIGQPLSFKGQQVQNGVEGHYYQSADERAALVIERAPCDRPNCPQVFGNILGALNQQTTGEDLTFEDVSVSGAFVIQFRQTLVSYMFVLPMPSAVHIFSYAVDAGTYAQSPDMKATLAALYPRITAYANRQRYEEALAEGNIEMGSWAGAIRAHALDLLADGKKADALTVLSRLVATSPFDFESQAILMDNADDPAVARASAEILLANAESRDIHARAAAHLGKPLMKLDTLPYVDRSNTGIRLVLIPLGDVDLDLLAEAGAVYETITRVPMQLRRLPTPWSDGMAVRPFLVIGGNIIDFRGLSVSDFIAQLRPTATMTAFGRYDLAKLEQRLAGNEGQFDAEPMLMRFLWTLGPSASSDKRTMYVGVTAANLFHGGARYVFSLHTGTSQVQGSIFSYRMLMARTWDGAAETRPRLVDRIAKELVVASLKSLGIPRPTDPSDPYSFANGIERVDQKSLRLSRPVAEALDKLR